MKYFLIVSLTFLFGCKTKTESKQAEGYFDTSKVQAKKALLQYRNNIYYWTGNINSTIPIFMWVVLKDSLIQGEVSYLKTKKKTPIKLLGHIDEDGDKKLCEYQKDGKITGVFVFDKLNESSVGTWASTETDKEYKFQLDRADTVLNNIDTSFQAHKLSGEYSYAYGEKGYNGDMTVKEISGNKIAFDVSSFTNEPNGYPALIDTDTVLVKNNEFIYQVPGGENCIIKVKFFKDFVFIDYWKDYGGCGDIFGLNAGVDGLFYRVSK